MIESPMSVRCEYCEGCDHLTRECPGLRHDNPSTRAFKAKRGYSRDMISSGPRYCWKCKQPENAGRKLFNSKRLHSIPELLCGDHMAFSGVPLEKQELPPLVKPEPERKGAWMTPTWEDVS